MATLPNTSLGASGAAQQAAAARPAGSLIVASALPRRVGRLRRAACAPRAVFPVSMDGRAGVAAARAAALARGPGHRRREPGRLARFVVRVADRAGAVRTKQLVLSVAR